MKFDSKSVFLPEIAVDGTFTKDMELDAALPEYAPDITRIIRIDARPGKPEITIAAGKAEIITPVKFGMLYRSDYRSKLAYIETEGELKQKADIAEVSGECYPKASVSCTYLTCKLLGPRKFVIRAKMSTDLSALNVKEYRAIDPDSTQVSAFFLTQKANARIPCGTYTDSYSFTESVPISKPADRVVYSRGDVGIPEISVSDGVITVKSDVQIRTLYETEDGENIVDMRTFPFTAELENAGITPDRSYNAELTVGNTEVLTEQDDYGENKVLRINYSVYLDVLCYENTAEVVASDAFCGDRASKCENASLKYDNYEGRVGRVFAFETTYETGRTDVSSLLDATVTFSVAECAATDGNLTFKGNAAVSVLALTDEGVISIDTDAALEETQSIELRGSRALSPSVRVLETNATLYGGNIVLRARVAAQADIYSDAEVSAAIDMTADDAPAASDGGMVFYYPADSETAWSVAKKYRRNPKKLIEDNRGVFESDGTLKSEAPAQSVAKFIAVK